MGKHEYIVQYKEAARESQNKVLNKARTEIQNQHPDIKFETKLEEGRPSDVIVKIAQEEDVDLIVMGSRGMGGIVGFLDSISRHVVEACTKSIIIVK